MPPWENRSFVKWVAAGLSVMEIESSGRNTGIAIFWNPDELSLWSSCRVFPAATAPQTLWEPAGGKKKKIRPTVQWADVGAKNKEKDYIYFFNLHNQAKLKPTYFVLNFLKKLQKNASLLEEIWKITFDRHPAVVVWWLSFSNKSDWKLVEMSPRFWHWTDCQTQFTTLDIFWIF